MSDIPAGAVVVGHDGSALADQALRWAAAEAALLRTGLHVLHATKLAGGSQAWAAYLEEDLSRYGDAVLEDAAETLADDDLTVTTGSISTTAGEALVEASRTAAVVVMGARGLGRLSGPLLGSTTQRVSAHAHGPVVVVRDEPTAPHGPVVVGLDPTGNADDAVRFAFDHAARRGLGVLLVQAIPPAPPVRDAFRDSRTIEIVERAARAAAADAQQQANRWREEFPDVPADVDIVHDHPVEAITDASRRGSLTVVGSRGRGGLASTLLGSVSRGVLQHAAVVAVVRPRQ
ncbi:universal stress protein [Georgenia sp. MJ170]|uniref:universal stress protein n=1 Tax=Georgenia sunbinii TaxID=3117728 RepID=UPI002F26B70A